MKKQKFVKEKNEREKRELTIKEMIVVRGGDTPRMEEYVPE